MEIRNQVIQYFKLISRINKNLCVSTSSLYDSVLVCCTFDGSAACCSYADDSAACCLGIINQLRSFRCHLIEFGMHMMLQYVLFLNRSECSQSYMQCHICDFTPFSATCASSSLVKCSPAVGAAAEPSYFAYTGLITVLILKFMCNVRRKWHLAQLIQYFFKNAFIGELYQSVTFIYYIHNGSCQ